MSLSPVPTATPSPLRKMPGWRLDAARLAGDLLRCVSPQAADEVLDLRSALLDAAISPGSLLRTFFAAKIQLEREHYLLFFRLRRVLEPNLGLRLGSDATARIQPIDFLTRSLSQLLRRTQQDLFEHDLSLARPEDAVVTVAWRLAPMVESLE